MKKKLYFPVTKEMIDSLEINDEILISGKIFCGRDAVLPKITKLIEEGKIEESGINLDGSLIFHTAVSRAGVGPTSSNKKEIEESIPCLSSAGVKMHLGKGALQKETVEKLKKYGSVYAVIPPVTALLGDRTLSQKLVAFPELGMEAFYELTVEDFPAVIAAAHGKSIYDSDEKK